MNLLPGVAAQTVSPFPNPPEYSQQYTSDRIDNGSAPPPPIPLTEFCVFGEEYKLEDDVISPLTNSGVRELYANKNNWKVEMKKLNRSAVIAFFDLVEVLIRSPDHPFREEKMNDLHTIFINMHHLINEFRPVQARDSVRILQERQIEELASICDSFRVYLKDGRDVVEEQFSSVGQKLDPPPEPSELTRIKLQEGLLREMLKHKVIAPKKVIKLEKPEEPEEPKEPGEPEEPGEPSEPSKPKEPSESEEPSESAEPAEPTEPAETSEPAEPAEPSEPADPSKPTESGESAESAETAETDKGRKTKSPTPNPMLKHLIREEGPPTAMHLLARQLSDINCSKKEKK